MLANPRQQQLLTNEESGLKVQLTQRKLDNVLSMYNCIALVEQYKLDGGLQARARLQTTLARGGGTAVVTVVRQRPVD